MHDSALRIGELVMQTYCDLPKARILEIGSMDVNGSLRKFAAPTTQYVGVDLDRGPAVDVVVKPGQKLPFDNSGFDLVMASSAFEHDPRFWDTFIEMCRVARPGGHIYINAPSNGGVHRYPLDCWRFYPDAGVALMQYAIDLGVKIDLVESFVGKRYPDTWDGWNDFVAVFRRAPSRKPLNKHFVYKRYPSYNARSWNSAELDYEMPLTEDMQIGRDLRLQLAEQEARFHNLEIEHSKAEECKNDLAAALRISETEALQLQSGLRQQLSEQVDKVYELELKRSQTEKCKDKLATDLRISESEVLQLRSAVAGLENQAQVLSSSLKTQADTVARLVKERGEAQKIRDKLTADLHISRTEASHLRSASTIIERQVSVLSSSLKAQTDAFGRIQERDLGVIGTLQAELSELREDHSSHVRHTSAELAQLRSREMELETELRSKNAQHDCDRNGMHWLRALHTAMSGRPVWWFLLPAGHRRQREYEMLRNVGLFDDQSYIVRYPDVAAAGTDALDHYVAHGMLEGRNRI